MFLADLSGYGTILASQKNYYSGRCLFVIPEGTNRIRVRVFSGVHVALPANQFGDHWLTVRLSCEHMIGTLQPTEPGYVVVRSRRRGCRSF